VKAALRGSTRSRQAARLVTRSPHPSDGHGTVAELTPAGREAIGRICPPLVDIEEDCMSELTSAEQDQRMNLLAKIQERIARRRATAAARAT
jgi:DNA-binding MarR family transcriptional regulator